MTKKVTFTLPERTIEMLEEVADNKSQFVTEAIEEKISEFNIRKNLAKARDPFDHFARHRADFPKYTTEEIIGLINKGRE